MQVFGFGRVGMVVGEIAVHFAEKLGNAAAQCAEQIACISAGHAVARVDDDIHRACQFDVVDDVCLIVGSHIFFAYIASGGVLHECVLLNGGQQLLNRLSSQRVASQHHFKAVVVGRIVAAGNHHAAAFAMLPGGEIEHRCGHHADVEYINAAVGKTA